VKGGVSLFDYKVPRKSSTFVFVGRLEQEKGLAVLLSAMKIAQTRNASLRLEVCGDGPQKEQCTAIAKGFGLLGKVRFHGNIPHDRLGVILARSAALIMPSLVPESLGLSGVEAMSVGRPVISSRMGAPSELIVNGVNGYLCRPGNEHDIADRMCEIASLDMRALGRMSRASRRTAETYGMKEHSKAIRLIYGRLSEA
jgi:glycosyltransferase involved in cell wall biosynthesis